jgi:hypothetical protein
MKNGRSSSRAVTAELLLRQRVFHMLCASVVNLEFCMPQYCVEELHRHGDMHVRLAVRDTSRAKRPRLLAAPLCSPAASAVPAAPCSGRLNTPEPDISTPLNTAPKGPLSKYTSTYRHRASATKSSAPDAFAQVAPSAADFHYDNIDDRDRTPDPDPDPIITETDDANITLAKSSASIAACARGCSSSISSSSASASASSASCSVLGKRKSSAASNVLPQVHDHFFRRHALIPLTFFLPAALHVHDRSVKCVPCSCHTEQ